MRLEGKVALIAGAGSNMSRATAILFAQEGAKIVLAARSNEQSDETVRVIRAKGGQAKFVRTDLTNEDQVRRLVDATTDEFGGLDILGHFAGGGYSHQRDVSAVPTSEWEELTNSILRTLFLSAKFAVSAIETRGGGVIFTVAAGHKVRQDANYTYGSARGAQISAAENLAKALYDKNIRAHCICPGIIWDRPASWEEPIRPAAPQLERLGNPIDIAYAALYLSSDESAWLTGQVISIEGGDDQFVGSPLRRSALEGLFGPD